MKKYIYGFDIGGTSVKIGLFNLTGDLLKRWEIDTNRADSGIHILHDIYQAIIDYNINLNEVLGYGFGVPGPVVDGIVIKCINIDWVNFDLVKKFGALVNNDLIFVENDANVAALGETVLGAGIGYKNSAMITVGTGVGGGIILDSKVVEGAHGAAGEIGHIKVSFDNPALCNCGGMGCLETVASATGIKRVFKEMKESTDIYTSLKDIGNPSVKTIFDAAKNGDVLSIAVVDKISHYLGYACHILSAVSNPEIIIIGGGVSNAGSFFVNKIEEHFKEMVFSPAYNTLIVLATLGNDAGIYGAASLVIND